MLQAVLEDHFGNGCCVRVQRHLWNLFENPDHSKAAKVQLWFRLRAIMMTMVMTEMTEMMMRTMMMMMRDGQVVAVVSCIFVIVSTLCLIFSTLPQVLIYLYFVF